MLVELDEKTYINVLHVINVQTTNIERAIVDKNEVGHLVNTNKSLVEVVDVFLANVPKSIQVEGVSAKEVAEVINKGLSFYQNALPMKAFFMVKLADLFINVFNVTMLQNSEIEEPAESKSGVIKMTRKVPGVEIYGTDIFIRGMMAKDVATIINKQIRGAVKKDEDA